MSDCKPKDKQHKSNRSSQVDFEVNSRINSVYTCVFALLLRVLIFHKKSTHKIQIVKHTYYFKSHFSNFVTICSGNEKSNRRKAQEIQLFGFHLTYICASLCVCALVVCAVFCVTVLFKFSQCLAFLECSPLSTIYLYLVHVCVYLLSPVIDIKSHFYCFFLHCLDTLADH